MPFVGPVGELFSAIGDLRRAPDRHLSLPWLTTAAAGAAALVLSVWWLSTDIAPLALKADTRLNEFRGVSASQLLQSDDAPLADLRANADRLEQDVSPAARSVGSLARLSPALSWLPGIGHELFTWSVQMDRLRTDVQAAQTLIAGSSQFLDIYQQAQTTLLSDSPQRSVTLLTSRTDELESSFTSAVSELSRVSKAGRRRAPAFHPPGSRDAMTLLAETEARMLAGSRIGVQASDLMTDLLEIADRAQPLIGQFTTGQEGPDTLTVAVLKETVTELDELLRFAIAKSDGLVRLINAGEDSGPIADRFTLLERLLDVLLVVNRATAVGIQVAEPVIEAARSSEGGLFGGGGQLVNALETAIDRQDEILTALALLDDARRTADQIAATSEFTLADLSPAIETLYTGLSLLKDFSSIGPDLIAVDSTKRYLVLGQSADELRATGGFVSAIWAVTFIDGALTDITYHDVVRVDDWERLHLYPQAPVGLEEHMNAHVWLLRDVSWEPDFPTTARTAADMFRIGQRQQVDGVVGLNQWTLLGIVQAMESVPSPEGGEDLTPRNLLIRLEQESDEHGRAYMDLALQGILQRLDESLSLSTLIRLASAVQTSFEERDLLLHVDDPDVQPVIAGLGWDGSLRNDASDYLFVVDSNVGWSKADRNIERTVDYAVDLSRGVGPRIALSLGYNNHSGPGSVGCEPQWLNRGSNYGDLKNACYWNYWRVYVPQGAKLLSSTRLPLPEHSVAVEIGRGLPDEDTLRVSSSYNRAVLSGLFPLAAGDGQKVTLVYDLPPEIIVRDDDDMHYRLVVQKQPGSRGRKVAVEFKLPEGYRLGSSSLEPASNGGSKVGFLLNENRDTVLSAVFTRDADAGK